MTLIILLIIFFIIFKIKPGDQVAFVGSSGSGKSTIIRLLERFYDSTGGMITIDDFNLKEIDLKNWRNQVGYV